MTVGVASAGAVGFSVPFFEAVAVFSKTVGGEGVVGADMVALACHLAFAGVLVEFDSVAFSWGDRDFFPLSVESDSLVVGGGETFDGLFVGVASAGAVGFSVPASEVVALFREGILSEGFLGSVVEGLISHLTSTSVTVEVDFVGVFSEDGIDGGVGGNVLEGFIPAGEGIAGFSRSSSGGGGVAAVRDGFGF